MNFFLPKTIQDASSILKNNEKDSEIIAGSTWLMRAPLRNEKIPNKLVSLSQIKDLHTIKSDRKEVIIGSMVNHSKLHNFLKSEIQFNCLKKSALESANESIRNSATIGGNLCALNFINSDLIPALLSLNAIIIIFDGKSVLELDIISFLEWRKNKKNHEIVSSIKIKKTKSISSHKRFLLRESGDYPLANLSINLNLDKSDFIENISISVGVVEKYAKKWLPFEAFLKNKKIEINLFKKKSKDFLYFFNSRDDVDCPGWYRLKILPKLVEDAFSEISFFIKREI